MFRKAIDVLKRNPVIMLFFAGYVVFSFLVQLGLLPRELIRTRGPGATPGAGGQLVLYEIIIIVLAMIFTSGLGLMLAEAVTKGVTSAGSFLQGIKRFFGRIIKVVLLIIAFCIGLGILFGILAVLFTIVNMFKGVDPTSFSVYSPIIIMVVFVFIAPLVMLWYPAIFVDNVSAIQGLKNGAKAGKENYWVLVAASFVSGILPVVNLIANNYVQNFYYSPAYSAIILISIVFTQFLLLFLFVVYAGEKIAKPENTPLVE